MFASRRFGQDLLLAEVEGGVEGPHRSFIALYFPLR